MNEFRKWINEKDEYVLSVLDQDAGFWYGIAEIDKEKDIDGCYTYSSRFLGVKNQFTGEENILDAKEAVELEIMRCLELRMTVYEIYLKSLRGEVYKEAEDE